MKTRALPTHWICIACAVALGVGCGGGGDDDPPPPLSVDFGATTSVAEGGLPVSGTVQIPAAVGADLIVTLSSNDTSQLTVDATITITAGATSSRQLSGIPEPTTSPSVTLTFQQTRKKQPAVR